MTTSTQSEIRRFVSEIDAARHFELRADSLDDPELAGLCRDEANRRRRFAELNELFDGLVTHPSIDKDWLAEWHGRLAGLMYGDTA